MQTGEIRLAFNKSSVLMFWRIFLFYLDFTPLKKLSYDILKLRNFRFLLVARMLGILALQSQAVIVGWQIYSLTKDPFMLGLTGLTEAVPAIIGALFAGHIVDNHHPQRIYFLCMIALTLNTFMLLLTAGGIIEVPPDMLIPIIFCGVFISGMARCFIAPTSFTLLAWIIPKKNMPSAAAWQSSGFQIAAIGGPAISGLVYGQFGAEVAWFIPTCMMFCAGIAVWCIRTPDKNKDKKAQKKPKAWTSIKEGWSFIIKNPVLLSVMTIDMFAVLFGGAVAMLPAFAEEILHIGSEGLGLLRAAPALGAVITALTLALYPLQTIKGKHLLLVVTGFGVCMIGFGFSTSFWVAMIFLALSGAFDSVSMVIRGTLMQFLTPEDMRGRVSSVNSMFIISSNEIGAFESGVAAKFLGLVPSIVFGGVGTLIVVAAAGALSPQLRNSAYRADDNLVEHKYKKGKP